ncbi:GntR family transcriptional regulator [Pollutimonas subterranea]|jgi:GntR family transcriptional repressor for pyruvate dehydrogenase complex|uniref:GntR family transcriptional regulator n=1 Tax=Pollutimonas subterranea TaxID=2045210 RepID=A0A2N4U5A8_9BURK|nr:FadR/GntR family transcriptional regulator [Pollutimonas subterranea]PLC50196.1 GntR family transcriptional regulator [Pollutimonas subterranea]
MDQPHTLSPTQSLTTPIAAWLKDEIEQQRLTPGSKLPSEKQLCEQFSVSRSVIREAVSQLKSEGLVSAQQGRGVFVNERGSRQSFRLDPTRLDDEEDVGYVIELLIAIEVAAARLAALRHTLDDLKKIKRALVGMEYAIVHEQLGDAEDYAFHQAIVDAAHNPHFITLNEYLEQHIRRLIRKARSNTAQQHQGLVECVQEEHHAIVRAIEARDPDAAASAAEAHLRNAAQRLSTYMAGPPQ